MRIHSFSGAAVFGLGVLLFWASAAASAPDARQIADSLVAATTATGRVQAEYQDATANGDVITVSGYKITRTSAKTIEIPAIIVTGAVMREAGGFTAQSIVFDKGTAIRGNDIVTWETGAVEGAIVPSAEEIKAEIDVRPFEKFAMSGVSLSESNLTKPVTVADIRVVFQAGPNDTPGAFAAQFSGIHFGAELLKGRPQEKAVVDALGYEEFDVNIAIAGAFDAQGQSMALNSMTINTAEVGTVTIKARLSGLSLGKIMATRTDAEARTEMNLDNLEIRFDNDGVVERALDMHAALIWGTREDAAAQVNAALPLVLHFLRNDQFQDQIAEAIRDFLAEPKSIAFSAAPSAPVSLEQILRTALDERHTLPDLLQANVSAN